MTSLLCGNPDCNLSGHTVACDNEDADQARLRYRGCDVAGLAKEFRKRTPDECKEAVEAFLAGAKAKSTRYMRARLVSAILVELQDWDLLWKQHGDYLGEYL